MLSNIPTTERLLRLPDVLTLIGLKRAAFYALVRAGKFPTPVHLTSRARAWRGRDVLEWIESRQQEG